MAEKNDSTALVPIAKAEMVQSGFYSGAGFDLMQRVAKAFALSSLVPKAFQNNMPNCVIALELAQRLGASPLMVMQNLYVVHGRPAWSAQFLVATFNQCGRFAAIRYRWAGKQGADDWSCTAFAVEKETGETIEGPTISIAVAKAEGWYQKDGSKWKTIPQLMLMYRSAAWLVRTHAPELSMGIQTREEIEDVRGMVIDVGEDDMSVPDNPELSKTENLAARIAKSPTVEPEAPEPNDQPTPENFREQSLAVDVANAEQEFPCLECGDIFTKAASLEAHTKTSHRAKGRG
jgi:hypothetical protein